MNIAVCDHCPPLKTYRSSGASTDSNILGNLYSDAKKHLSKPVALSRRREEAIDLLDDVYEEASQENWDGYGALPVSSETYLEAEKLIELLPEYVSIPEILAEPTGSIGFEWILNNNKYDFVLSLKGKDEIVYAGLLGVNRIHGKEYFGDSLPPLIERTFRRIFQSI